ncbi:MAG: MMPL family transporter, partial [Phycisphaerales bacterium JB059]
MRHPLEHAVVRRLELLGGAMLRRSWLVVLLFVPVTLLSAWIAAQTLGVNTDTSAMVSEDLPHRVAQREYAAAFPEAGSEIILLVEGGTRDLRELGAERLVEALRERPELFERVESAASDPFFARHGLLYMETERLRAMAAGLQGAAPALGALRRDPSIRGMAPLLMGALRAPEGSRPERLDELVREAGEAVRAAREGRVRRVAWRELLMGQGGAERVIVQAAPVFDYEALYPAGPALDAIDQVRAGLDLGDERGVRVRVTGEAALATDELRSASNGAGIATGVAMLGVLVILYLGLRSVRMMLACTVTLAVGLLGTAAFAGLAVGHLNLISVAFAVLYIGLGIDYAIHVCLRYREAVAGGWSHGAAALVALRHTGPALVVCALTTSVGFFAFIPTAFEGVSELGLIAGAVMFIGLAVNLLLLPAILVLQGKPRGYGREEASVGAWRRVTALPERRRWWFRGLGLGGAVVAVRMAPRVLFVQKRLNQQDPARE